MVCSSLKELHVFSRSRLRFLHAVACNKTEASSGDGASGECGEVGKSGEFG